MIGYMGGRVKLKLGPTCKGDYDVWIIFVSHLLIICIYYTEYYKVADSELYTYSVTK